MKGQERRKGNWQHHSQMMKILEQREKMDKAVENVVDMMEQLGGGQGMARDYSPIYKVHNFACMGFTRCKEPDPDNLKKQRQTTRPRNQESQLSDN